ncbi:hypothetical protein [Flavobacterium sp. '19STA2R22 D10 B1']|uniref:hypothetical protein n=1 Tax=Flavobacterium aerium TaxID=3037261 RepID=UPI00278C77E9|nr:hypothetical protein [Flavobacterium sp. '19STA2R22 D10 B1']
MTSPKRYLILLQIICLLFYTQTKAQDDFGGNPSHLNWQVLTSPAANIIFPQGLEAKAARISNIINTVQENNSQSVGDRFKKINIVLQNQNVNANGYVGLAPFCSKFFTTPPEDMNRLGTLNWLDNLSLHEYRHVLQYVNANRGLTKIFDVLQGESGWAVLSHLSIPNWYFEGDAVMTETMLSNAGRGRTPSFTVEQRALVQAGINYPYMKARNGSYKDIVPSHYPLGYMMLSQLQTEKTDTLNKKILADAGRYKAGFYPFSSALEKYTGYRAPSLYTASWKAFQQKWSSHLNKTQLTSTSVITPKQKETVTNYYFPQFDTKGSIIALKNDYKRTEAIYRITENGEEKITTMGYNLGQYLFYNNEKLVWTELSQHPRRTNISYSDIYFYDISKQEKRKITTKGKYFSPVISSDGRTIIAIHIDELQQHTLQSITTESGATQILLRFDNDEFISRSTIATDNNAVVYIFKKNNQIALYKYNLTDQTNTQLTPWTAHVIDDPRVHENYVYYTAGFSGIDNLYRTPLNGSQSVEQLTSVPVGAYQPALSTDGKKLLFTEFTEKGYIISEMSMENKITDNKASIVIEEPNTMAIFGNPGFTKKGNILDKVPTNEYPIKSYNGLFKGLRFHSWNIAPDLSTPTLSLQMNNYLNDVSVILNGGYNNNENGVFYNGKLSIARWYPVITLNTAQREHSAYYQSSATNIRTLYFNETSFGASVALPYHWIKDNFSTQFSIALGADHHILTKRRTRVQDYATSNLNTFDAIIQFSSLKRIARQNMGSRLGISGRFEYYRNISNAENEKIKMLGAVYLPGIGANHNLKLGVGYQKELLTNEFQFSDNFNYPRGYETPVNDQFTKFSADYAFPLFYPDWGFGGITYIKRISANLFYDLGKATLKGFDRSTTYQSVGVELTFDTTFFNAAPISIGFRGSYLLNEDPFNLNTTFVPSIFLAAGF